MSDIKSNNPHLTGGEKNKTNNPKNKKKQRFGNHSRDQSSSGSFFFGGFCRVFCCFRTNLNKSRLIVINPMSAFRIF